jgi:hypothetical protein
MNLISSTVLTENLVSDRVGIGESKAELERLVQRDYFAKILDAFASMSCVSERRQSFPTRSENQQLKVVRRRARSDGATRRLQETQRPCRPIVPSANRVSLSNER